jgi:hypothetical protein
MAIFGGHDRPGNLQHRNEHRDLDRSDRLIGIAEDDGVVIATYMEQLFARRPMRQRCRIFATSTVEAGRRRIRPV